MLLSNPSAGKMRVFDPYVREMVTGKSVLVLGSAPSVVDVKAVSMEDFDVIVRVNNFKFFNSCKRTDIWYTMAGGSIKKSLEELRTGKCRLCFLKNPFAKIEARLPNGEIDPLRSVDFRAAYAKKRYRWFELPWYIQTKSRWPWLTDKIGQIPTTGLAAVVDIYRFRPSMMHVAGFDFFSSLTHNIDRPIRLKPWPKHHDFEAEMLFMRQLVRRCKNITCDHTMKRIFAAPKQFPKIGSKPDATANARS